MGLFGDKLCDVCGAKTSMLLRHSTRDGRICTNCFGKLGFVVGFDAKTPVELFSTEYCKLRMHRIEQGKVDFADRVIFDDEKQECLIAGVMTENYKFEDVKCQYKDIVDFELLQDNESISSGGLGRALVGGALLGSVGAVVGAVTGDKKAKGTCKSLKIKLTVKNNTRPTIYIDFITKEIKTEKNEYKKFFQMAQDCLSKFDIICKVQNTTSNVSAADEILKYKQLLDANVITSEEFELKKKQLLGL